MVRPVTVLVSGAGSAPARTIVRALRAQQVLPVRLVGIDASATSFALFDCDARARLPRCDDPRFLDAVRAICQREHVDVVLPTLDVELPIWAQAARALRDELGVRVVIDAPETIALARDKRRSTATVARAGVAVPACYEGAAVAHARLPLVVKPTVGAGSVGVSFVRTAEALLPALAAAGPAPYVQELVEGVEHTVDLVIDADGHVLASAPRVRVEVRAGQSYKGRTVDAPHVEDAARRAASALGLRAQANVQILATSDGRAVFVEANPKFAAAMGLTIGAGLDVPLLYVQLALGIPVRPEQLVRRPDVWMLRAWEERYVDAATLAGVRAWDDEG